MREGWTQTTLGEVAQWHSGGTPKAGAAKFYDNGSIPWVVISDMLQGEIHDTATRITQEALEAIGGRLAPSDSVLISMYATVGRPAIARIPVATNQAIAWSVPDINLIFPRFLLLVAQGLEHEISSLARGATQRNINRAMLREFSFLLPPLAEQRRIVDVIGSVDAYVASLESYANAARTARAALLHELLTTNTQGWKETTLGEVAQWHSGGTPKAGAAKFYDNGSIPWVVISDMLQGEIHDTATRITQEALEAIGGRLAPSDSVLISMYATVGRPAIARIPVATNQAIAWSIPDIKLILPWFLLLVAQGLEHEISSQARGATQRNINRAMLREFSFFLPPLAEQKRIVDVIGAVDGAIAGADRAAEDARNLRSGLLSDLLSGDHEIPAGYDRLLGAA